MYKYLYRIGFFLIGIFSCANLGEVTIYSSVDWLFYPPGKYEIGEYASVRSRKVNLEVKEFYHKGVKGTHYRVKEDFIAHIGDEFTDNSVQRSSDVQHYLNKMMKLSKKDVVAYYKGLQLLSQTKLWSDAEKIKWLEKNIHELMPPYMIYLAILKLDQSEYEAYSYYVAALDWTIKELRYCKDHSAQAGIEVLAAWFAREHVRRYWRMNPDRTYTLTIDGEKMKVTGRMLLASKSLYDSVVNEQSVFQLMLRTNMELMDASTIDQKKVRASAEVIADRLTISKRPYWIAYHGMQAFQGKLSKKSFKREEEL